MGRAHEITGQPLGFLQLCADRRFHRQVMTAFERHGGLAEAHGAAAATSYWIEATPGGALALGDMTVTCRHALSKGARVVGVAVHGDDCGGYGKWSTSDLEAALLGAMERRAGMPAFAGVTHLGFMATEQALRVYRIKGTKAELECWYALGDVACAERLTSGEPLD